ncbi:MAG: CHAT domain-containing protein, partial [Chitinophagaceae bacterium]
LSTLDTSISINEKINSYDAKIRNAELNKFIGKVNNDKGKPAVALEAFLKAADIYRNNRDISAGAIVGNEIAYSYYLLGEYRKGILIAQANIKPLLESADFDNAGYSHTVAGSCYWELGKYDSAVIENKKSIALRKKGNNLSGQAISWKKIGELYLLSGLKDDALQAFDSAALIFTYLKDNAGLADVYNKKGEVFLNDESYKRATDLFEKAKGVNNKVTVEAFYNLGSAWQEIDTAKARSYFETSRNLSIKSGNTNFQFFSSKSLARNHYRSQNFLAGDRFYDECVSLSQQLNTLEADANCLSLKAYRFYSEPRLDSALFYYQKAFNIFDSVDKNQAIWQLNSLSDVYMSKGEYVKANEVLNKAINLAISTSNNLGLGYTLQVTSFLYGLTAEFEKGINNNDSAIGIFKNSGNVIRLAGTYGSRGSLLGKMGEYRQAVNAYSFADSIYKAELLEENRGTIFNNIGIIYLNQSDYTTALRYFQQSLSKLKKGVYDESYLLVQGNITECLFRLKKVKEAKAILLDILPKARKLNLNRIATGMAIILGNIFADEKNLREAGFYFNYARDFAVASGEKDKMIEALISLGRINSTEGKIDSAENNFRRAAGFVSEYKTGSGWNAYYELGLLFYNQQIFDSAIVYFRQAVELLDKNAENLYGGEEAKKIFNNDPQKADLYNKITFSYYSSGNIKEAWAYANRSNIAGIKELSGTLTAASSDEEKNDALKKLLAMQQSKKALETAMEKQQGTEKRATLAKIEILETDYNNFLQDVVALYPELSTYFSRSNADEFNNYKSKLPKDVAVLLYLLNDKTLMIFSLTNEKLSVDTMTADISQKVVAFIDAIKNTTKKTGTGPLSLRSDPEDEEVNKQVYNFKDISDELYAILFASVSAKVADKRKLCIIPTGIFSNMPFQCLGKKMAGNSFRFLIEDYSIFYTNKMSVFNSNYKDSLVKKDLTSFAAFGVPDATLRFNISEVKEIGKILGTDSTIYTDTRATESMAKNSLLQKKYIHFATHGVLNYSTDFSQSYLKLLPDKDTTGGNNGKLTMREVQKLGITDCEMVILSACQTAISKELVKGWNISPANSFLVSHVKTVVASLWKVADEPTGLLMQYFYENLNSSISKTEALRLAQVRLSNDARYSHPNYWGAFVLYGDWQ